MKNLIARAIGPRAELEPELHVLQRRPESRYLLCSDGASGTLSGETLRTIMEEAPTPRKAVDRILRDVLRAEQSLDEEALLADALSKVETMFTYPER